MQRHKADKLGFLAAHHISIAALTQAGQNGHRNARIGNVRANSPHRQISRRCWHFAVRRFAPALLGPGHAANHHRDRLTIGYICGQPTVNQVDQNPFERQFFVTGNRIHAKRAALGGKDVSVIIHRPDPQVGRAPVNRDPAWQGLLFHW